MLAFDRRGSGEPVVLIHGMGHRRQGWAPIAERLAQNHDVTAVDLPGCGESPKLHRSSTQTHMSAIDDRFRRLFDELGVDRPHLVGNSVGGLYALDLAARGLARSVTALCPVGFGRGPVDTVYTAGVFGGLLAGAYALKPIEAQALGNRSIRTAALGLLFGDPAAIPQSIAVADLNAFRASMPDVDALRYAARSFDAETLDPAIPVSFAWGEKDRLLLAPAWHADRARRALPRSRHFSLPGAGHIPVADDPERILRIITANIARTNHRGDN